MAAVEAKKIASEEGDLRILTTGQSNFFTHSELVYPSLITEGEFFTIPFGGPGEASRQQKLHLKYHNGRFLNSGNKLATSNSPEVETKYIWYYLLENSEVVKSHFYGASMGHPRMSRILEMLIPVPPLKIQQEIIGILDKLNQLQEDIQAELKERAAQYEYYSNKLLTFKERSE